MHNHKPVAIKRRRFLGNTLIAAGAVTGAALSPRIGAGQTNAADRSGSENAGKGVLNQAQVPCDPSLPWPENGVTSEMSVGEIRQIASINPLPYYYPTLIRLTPGAEYRFSADGSWADGKITASPDGWLAFILEAGARLPFRRLFLLCGSVGRTDRRIFAIGSGRVWKAPATDQMPQDRQLYLFPNDWKVKWVYRNNREIPGKPLRVTVHRLS